MVINIDVADLGAYHRIGRLKWLISDPKLKSRHLRCSLGNICAATSKSFGVSISIDPRCIMHNLFVKEITIWNRIIKITEINEWSSNDSSNSIANKENNHAFFAFSLLRISRTQEQKHVDEHVRVLMFSYPDLECSFFISIIYFEHYLLFPDLMKLQGSFKHEIWCFCLLSNPC